MKLHCRSSEVENCSLGLGDWVGIQDIICFMPPGMRSDSSVRRAIKSGKIPARKLSGRWALNPAHVQSTLLSEHGARQRMNQTLMALDEENRYLRNHPPHKSHRYLKAS
jgi:hypothetical protein